MPEKKYISILDLGKMMKSIDGCIKIVLYFSTYLYHIEASNCQTKFYSKQKIAENSNQMWCARKKKWGNKMEDLFIGIHFLSF